MSGRRVQFVLGAVLITLSGLVHAKAATTATKHKPPKHPEAVHPTAQKGTRHSSHKTGHHYAKKTKAHKRGQQAIDNERATQIQQALLRDHYLKGTPSGTWDASTQEAMRRYQADQGWQTKEVPDSRALIRLGLGPDKGHLLNPESAMTTDPQLPHVASSARTSANSDVSSSNAIGSSTPVSAPASAAPDLSPSR